MGRARMTTDRQHFIDKGMVDPATVRIGGSNQRVTMQALDEEYARLLAEHRALEVVSHQQSETECWTHDAELAWLAKIDPLRDRMFEIANEIADMPARSDDDLRTKAKVLMDFANGETGDVVHKLATTLSADILARRQN
jgi:hypothetical protein